MDKWLDAYLGEGATDIIWATPFAKSYEALRNRTPEEQAENLERLRRAVQP